MMTNWTDYRQSIRWHLEHNSLDDFLQWSTIQATMFVGNAPYIDLEYDCLLGSRQSAQWARAIKENWLGKPTPFNDHTSGNLIHQAYHLKQWLDRTKQKLGEMSSIVEIGAGYGAMTLVCYQLGFKGQYVIYDLPELIQIQQYYLNKVGVGNISWNLSLRSNIPAWLSFDLCIASHSLGEMPVEEREQLLSRVAAKEYLFVSSFEYEGVNNQAWFQQFAGSRLGIDWLFYPHPFYENAFYLVGTELNGKPE